MIRDGLERTHSVRPLLADRSAAKIGRKRFHFLVQLSKTVKTVPAVSRHPTGLRHVPQLFGQVQQADRHFDHFLCLFHRRRLLAPRPGLKTPTIKTTCQVMFQLMQIMPADLLEPPEPHTPENRPGPPNPPALEDNAGDPSPHRGIDCL